MLSKRNLPNHIEYEIPSPSHAVQFSNVLTRKLLNRRIIPEAELEVRRKKNKSCMVKTCIFIYKVPYRDMITQVHRKKSVRRDVRGD